MTRKETRFFYKKENRNASLTHSAISVYAVCIPTDSFGSYLTIGIVYQSPKGIWRAAARYIGKGNKFKYQGKIYRVMPYSGSPYTPFPYAGKTRDEAGVFLYARMVM